MKAFGKLIAGNNMRQLIENKTTVELWVKMSSKPADRWKEYLDAEYRGTRAQKLGALDRFINAIFDVPQAVWMQWAIDVCLQLKQKSIDLTIRSINRN